MGEYLLVKEAQSGTKQVPRNIGCVLKNLKHAIAVRRKEDGFDFSSPEKLWGEITYKGASHHFSYHQDEQLKRILHRYRDLHTGKDIPHNIENVLRSISCIGRLSGTCKCDSQKIRESMITETDRLFNSVAETVMNEACVIDFSEIQLLSSKKSSSVTSKASAGDSTTSSSSVSLPVSTTDKSIVSDSYDSLSTSGDSNSSQQSPPKDYPSKYSRVKTGRQRTVSSTRRANTPNKTFCDVGVCTDTIISDISTQTICHQYTQTDLSHLAGKKLPLFKDHL